MQSIGALASTGDVARLLGLPEGRIHDGIRRRKINPPQFKVAGKYVWTEDDIGRARAALLPVVMSDDSGAGQ